MSHSSPQNGISIIIPSYNRVNFMQRLLVSIDNACKLYNDAFEVIVVDSSKEREKQYIKRTTFNHPIKYIDSDANASLQRNIGALNAKYNFLLFIDSDCEVKIDLLQEYKKIIDQNINDESFGCCIGRVLFKGDAGLIWESVNTTPILDCFDLVSSKIKSNWGVTANILFTKKAFNIVGGYDESFQKPGGEDVDIGLRIFNLGFKVILGSNVIVWHGKESWDTIVGNIKRFWAYGSADVRLILKHPERVRLDFPVPIIHFLFLFLFIFIVSFFTNRNFLFTFSTLFIWFLTYLSIYYISSSNSKSSTIKIFYKQVVSWLVGQLLMTVLDSARVYTALKNRNFNIIYKNFLFFENQIETDWEDIINCQRSLLISWIITFLFVCLS